MAPGRTAPRMTASKLAYTFAVPEPSTLVLLLSGIGCLMAS
jgi:hypothetical protein